MIITLAIAGLFSSCSTNLYVPNTVNVPLLKEQGEVKLNITETDAQVAVGVTKHIGVMVNGFSKNYEGKEYFKHYGRLAEIGVGYYTPLKNKNLIFEAYGGAGMGKVDKTVTYMNWEKNKEFSNNFHATGYRYFVQPSIGYTNKYFDLAFTPRFTYLQYTRFTSMGFTEYDLMMEYLDNGKLTKSYFTFLEPALTLRAGYKWVKLQAQYGFLVKLGNQEIKAPSQFGSLGLVFDFARWNKKTSKTK
jgi:hypothetical protein